MNYSQHIMESVAEALEGRFDEFYKLSTQDALKAMHLIVETLVARIKTIELIQRNLKDDLNDTIRRAQPAPKDPKRY